MISYAGGGLPMEVEVEAFLAGKWGT